MPRPQTTHSIERDTVNDRYVLKVSTTHTVYSDSLYGTDRTITARYTALIFRPTEDLSELLERWYCNARKHELPAPIWLDGLDLIYAVCDPPVNIDTPTALQDEA